MISMKLKQRRLIKMEEKGEIRLKLSKVILLVVILVLIIALGVVYYLGFVKNKNQVENMQASNVSAYEKQQESNKTENSNKNELMKIVSKTDELNYEEIKEELRPDEVLYVTNVIKNNDNTYTLQGVIYSIYTLTQNELDDIIEKGTFDIGGKSYNVLKNSETGEWELYETNEKWPFYIIHLSNISGYYLERQTSLSEVYKLTQEKRQITVNENMICNDTYGGSTIVKEEFENFKTREPDVNSTCPVPFYRFKFKNGQCVSIIVEPGQ